MWIGNVPQETTNEDLAAVLGIFGALVSCFLFNRSAASSTGFQSGFVRYAKRQMAENVMAVVTCGRIVVNGVDIEARWASRNSHLSKELQFH